MVMTAGSDRTAAFEKAHASGLIRVQDNSYRFGELALGGNVLRKTVSRPYAPELLPIRYSAGGSMTGSMSMVAAA